MGFGVGKDPLSGQHMVWVDHLQSYYAPDGTILNAKLKVVEVCTLSLGNATNYVKERNSYKVRNSLQRKSAV